MVNRITTVLRYPGGKSKALKKILPVILKDYINENGVFKEYREPFVGGGSVFIALKQELKDHQIKYRINDKNENLICFWKMVKDNPILFVNEIKKIKESYPDGKSLYNYYNKYYQPNNDFEKAIKFYIRNRITFSGNTDSGGYSQEAFERRFTMSSINKIEALSTLLKDVSITKNNYTRLLFKPGNKVFIYLDPPYFTAMKSELYGRNGDLHKLFNHQSLRNSMVMCNHDWLMTYDDCPEIRKLYDFAFKYEWELQYGVNNGKFKSKIGKELFISNRKIESLKERLVD